MAPAPSGTPASLDLDGILVAAVTPFDPATGEVDLPAMAANLERWATTPVRGVLVAGSTGEAPLLDLDERDALVRTARRTLPADRIVVAGAGAESTRGAVHSAQAAARAGADAVLVPPPSFFGDGVSAEGMLAHLRAVAEASPVPVLLYQPPPRFATVELPAARIVEMASLPNLIGIKDSRGDLAIQIEVLREAPPGFRFLTGSAGGLRAALEAGAAGAILAAAGFAPAFACAVHRAVRSGEDEAAADAQAPLARLGREIVARFGVPGVKAAMALTGGRGGPPRPPLQPLTPEDRSALRTLLEGSGLLDTPAAAG